LRLLVVSHPAVVEVNQEPYRELASRGWEVRLVVPARWRHAFSGSAFSPHAISGLEDALLAVPVLLAGRPQRYLYRASCRRMIASAEPDVVFVEAESFSLVASQWRRAARACEVPFGVQCAENIDRGLPAPVRLLRSLVLRDAAFVAARSESAATLARSWGARGEVAFAPHAVPDWPAEPTPAPTPVASADPLLTPQQRPFTVGYAGRLVESKGLLDLLAAVRMLEAPVEMVLAGDGELRGELEEQPIPGSRVRVLRGLAHEQMASAYAQMDVLVLPSHTTPTWKEQFGRVIVEALWCGVPVVGSDSGEIPWLVGFTGGGLLYPEGDVAALAGCLERLRADPALRRELAAAGRASCERHFSVSAATDSLERLLLAAAPGSSPRSSRGVGAGV
jgi:glycosyltransferase involved in cell wall biosynthesis